MARDQLYTDPEDELIPNVKQTNKNEMYRSIELIFAYLLIKSCMCVRVCKDRLVFD